MHPLTRSALDRLRRLTRWPLRPAERWCLAGAAVCFAWVGWVWIDGALWQERQMARLAASAEAEPAAHSAPAAAAHRGTHRGTSRSAPPAPPPLPPVELSADGPHWGRAAGDPEPPEDVDHPGRRRARSPPVPSVAGTIPALPGDPGPASPADAPPPPSLAVPGALGELSVPRLGLSWAVAEGVAAGTLRRAPGWIPGTARPGSPGNVGIAGHRDRHFRRLEEVAVGDELVLGTPAGPRRYRVDWVRVVSPGETGVLAPTGADSLTLVTCFPFRWVGPAPERFVVRATAIDGGLG